jgi:hypothetical protein
MIEKYTACGGSSSRDKKLHQEALTMLADAKRKIEYLRMQLLLLRNKKPGGTSSDKGTNSWQCGFVFCMVSGTDTGLTFSFKNVS